MRVSIDTFVFLARCGDSAALACALFLDRNRDAEGWAEGARLGAGWPGIPFVSAGFPAAC